MVDLDALEAAGIANARGRAGLIDYLDKLGFTADEMVEAERSGRLFGLAGDGCRARAARSTACGRPPRRSMYPSASLPRPGQ
jgi:hypothetical protein